LQVVNLEELNTMAVKQRIFNKQKGLYDENLIVKMPIYPESQRKYNKAQSCVSRINLFLLHGF